MVILKVFVQKKSAQQHRQTLCDRLSLSINLSGVKDEPGRLPASAAVAVCRSQSLPEAEIERERDRKKERKKSPPDLLTGRESQDRGTCCNLLTWLFTVRAVLLQWLMVPTNRLMRRPVGGGFESTTSLLLPLAARQQAGGKESSKTHLNGVESQKKEKLKDQF